MSVRPAFTRRHTVKYRRAFVDTAIQIVPGAENDSYTRALACAPRLYRVRITHRRRNDRCAEVLCDPPRCCRRPLRILPRAGTIRPIHADILFSRHAEFHVRYVYCRRLSLSSLYELLRSAVACAPIICYRFYYGIRLYILRDRISGNNMKCCPWYAKILFAVKSRNYLVHALKIRNIKLGLYFWRLLYIDTAIDFFINTFLYMKLDN